MPNPARKRNLALVVLVAAIAAVGAALAFPGPAQQLTWQVVLTIGGLTVGMFAAVYLVLRQIDVVRFARLQRGEGVLATWSIPPDQWQDFQRRSREWDATPNVGLNAVDVGQEPSSDGVQISVSDNALLVGDDFHSIEKNASVHVNRDWMEFDTYLPSVDTASSRHVYHRLPIAPGAEARALVIEQHYAQAYAVAASNSRVKIYLAIGLVGLPLVVAVLMWWFDWI